MIGDLTSQPEPIVIKLFCQDAKLLADSAPRVADAIDKVHGVVDVLNGIENTISGPATTFQINPTVAARAGFTPEEVAVDASAILEGEPAATPVVLNDRLYTIRVRFPEQSRASLVSSVLPMRSREARLCSGNRTRIVYRRSFNTTGVAAGSPSRTAAASMATSSRANPERAATAGFT